MTNKRQRLSFTKRRVPGLTFTDHTTSDMQSNGGSDHGRDEMTSTDGTPRPQARRKKRRIGIALQGGGSWGAYSWGVLDALLADPDVEIAAFSGASAGALNAAIVASALASGTAESATQALASFWRRIAEPAVADVVRKLFRTYGSHWNDSLSEWVQAGLTLNRRASQALGVHPLRDLVAGQLDVRTLRTSRSPALFVTVTSALTGRPRVISNEDVTVDALLASASLPQFFPAVEVDGEPCWDGGFTGNPTLWPLVSRGGTDDVVLVQLVPDRVDHVPVEAAAIRRRVTQIVFNSSLVTELGFIHAARESGGADAWRLRLHRVGPPASKLFDEGDALDRGPAWLELLHKEGAAAGRRFLAEHKQNLGERETFDVASFLAARPENRMADRPDRPARCAKTTAEV
jgi:NTE family protein